MRAKGEQRERRTALLRLQEGTIASSRRLRENLHGVHEGGGCRGGGRKGQGEGQGGKQRDRRTALLRLQEGTIASSKRLSENLHGVEGVSGAG